MNNLTANDQFLNKEKEIKKDIEVTTVWRNSQPGAHTYGCELREGRREVFSEVGGWKGELSMTCWKGQPSVTLPLNILLNDVPRLLTPADKARKHYTIRRAPPHLLLFSPSLSPRSHSLSHTHAHTLSAHHLMLPRVRFLIIKKAISPKVSQLFFRLSDLPGPGWFLQRLLEVEI